MAENTNPYIDLHDSLQWKWWNEALTICHREWRLLTDAEQKFVNDMIEGHNFLKQEHKVTRKQFEWLRQIAREVQTR